MTFFTMIGSADVVFYCRTVQYTTASYDYLLYICYTTAYSIDLLQRGS